MSVKFMHFFPRFLPPENAVKNGDCSSMEQLSHLFRQRKPPGLFQYLMDFDLIKHVLK